MLSIIIPTYNEENYLPILLKSIRNQIFFDYEVIVADNNSSDRTKEIALSYGSILTQGGLPGKGRNLGAKIAKGEYLLFFDADVELTNRYFLADCFSELKSNKLAGATNCILPLSNSRIDELGHNSYNLIMKSMVHSSPIAPGFCIWMKKDIHQIINGFNEEIKLGEDTDYVKRASKISSFGILKSHKIPVSVRRLERDGRFNVAMKYILCGLHMAVLGNVKSYIFKYTFGH